ncbi:hypothetical protein [Herminiimonas arsenitoxidans]|uniref:hypothetical protein n=1 Tax=Herminiimonas arsenitoxidans TaxID=1809410 RepID=UPI0009710F18|nr:hypothetical protein [Herminiimonas arsenitoxidans]
MRYAGLLLPLLLSACASTGSGDGRVLITTASNGQEFGGANCVVTTNASSWNVVTPASVQVGRSNGELRIICNKYGYRTSELRLPPSGGQPTGSRVGLGLGGGSGAVGLGLGLSLPITSGGGGYPARVVVNMNPQ